VIACGSGGVLVDVLADMSFRLHPLTAREARDMVGALRGVRLLRGYRGGPPADESALHEVLLRLSQLMSIAPEIQELDVNPLTVHEQGATAIDVRIRVAAAPPAPTGRHVEY
jgi:acyl-CoA synthetase (NDP forming)